MPRQVAPRIFISYARSDGKHVAADLRRRLSDEHGFTLWQDLADMEGGKDWWAQITAAIDQVEHVILVMTTAAMASSTVAEEWRYARLRGRCVIPVMGASDLDFSTLPGWMRRAHFVDPGVPEQWRRLVRTLEGPCQTPRVPLMAERPPVDFVPRLQELQALRSRLLDSSRRAPVALTAALRGAGGYGKTTLARALCYDEGIQDAFHDGVLWVTLGQEPGDVGSKVEDLIVALSGEPSHVVSLEARKTRLAELLRDRHVLLVIDDVWSHDHLEPFLVGGVNCARLITTRNSETLPRGAEEVRVDAMASREAVALLGWDLPPGEESALRSLGQRLGEWPLLLKLVNGVLRDRIGRMRDTLPGAIQHVMRVLDQRGLTAFDARQAADRSHAVARTISVSMDALTPHEQARFRDLAVFPEDADAPLATIENLWARTGALDDLDTEQLIQRLFGLSLLWDVNLTTRRVRIHDVIRTYLRQQAGSDAMSRVNEALVESYRETCPRGWSTGPDDGYFFTYLLWHLAAAGRSDEIRSLLLDFSWIEAKLRSAGVGAVLGDYEEFGKDNTVRLLGQVLRLSALSLARDPGSLPSQLFGRIDLAQDPELALVMTQAADAQKSPWLRSRIPGLVRPGGALLQTLVGHVGAVKTVAVASDGRRAVSGAADGTLRTWDLRTGQVMMRLGGDLGSVRAVTVAPDGQRAVSESEDGTVRLWELDSGRALATLEDQTSAITAVAMTRDGRLVISGSADGGVTVWNVETASAVMTLNGHAEAISTVTVSPDGRRAVSTSFRGALDVWDLATGRAVMTVEAHTGQAWRAVAQDARRAVAEWADGTLRVWDLDTGRVAATLDGFVPPFSQVAITADARRVFVRPPDGTVTVRDLDTGQAMATPQLDTRLSPVAVAPDGRRAVLSSWDVAVGQRLTGWNLDGGGAVVISDVEWDTAIALTPDGKQVLAYCSDGTLKLWDLDSAQMVATLGGRPGRVRTVEITSDGRRAVAVAESGTLTVWDLDTGRVGGSLEGLTRGPIALAVTPDGPRAAAVLENGTLRVWNLDTAHVVAALEGAARARSAIGPVSVARDAWIALSGLNDSWITVWDLGTGAVIGKLGEHNAWVTSVAVTADGRHAVTGSQDGTVNVWDVPAQRAIATLQRETREIEQVAIAPDGRHVLSISATQTLVWYVPTGEVVGTVQGVHDWARVAITADWRRAITASYDGTLTVLDLTTGQAVVTLDGHTHAVTSIAVTPDGRRAVSGSRDRTLRVWDVDTGQMLAQFDGHDDAIRSVAVTHDGRRAVSASDDRTLKVWDLIGSPRAPFSGGHIPGVTAVAVTRDGRRAISATTERTLTVWDPDTGRPTATLHGHAAAVWSVAMTPDGLRAVSGSADDTVRVWDLTTGRSLATLDAHTRGVGPVAIAPDGRRALSGSTDGTVKVWDLTTGRTVALLDGHTRSVTALAVTPSGQRAVTGSADGTVKVWDLETGTVVAALSNQQAGVRALAVTSDGPSLLSVSDDGTLTIWDLQTGRQRPPLHGLTSEVTSVAITPDARRAVSGSRDGTLQVWDLATRRAIATFHSDGAVTAVACTDGPLVLAGSSLGAMHFLELRERAPLSSRLSTC